VTLPFLVPEVNASILFPEAIRKLGLTSSLQLCLDARDKDSFTSGQKWLDRSGNGYDFFVGADGSATATDPTFTGVAGMPSAYFGFDGGDYFTYDTTDETWMQNIHKDNAAFTLATWFYPGASGTIQCLAGTNGVSNAVGFDWRVNATPNLALFIRAGGGVTPLNRASTAQASSGAWNFLAVSVDEAAGTGEMVVNGVAQSIATTYTTPSASNAAFTMQIGAGGNNALPVLNAGRLAAFAGWSRSLTASELSAVFNETRQSFGV
jgi:Concanavalin A-like lectin/glucanases superfamily